MDRAPGSIVRTPRDIVEHYRAQHQPDDWVAWPEGPGKLPQIKTIEAVIIAAGTVVHIGEKTTLIRHRRAMMFVQWFADALPPAVKIGARIGLLGKVRTFNNGYRFQIRDALLLNKSPKSILNALMKVLPGAVLNPEEYLTDSEIEELVRPWE
jgi:hypothetical protein